MHNMSNARKKKQNVVSEFAYFFSEMLNVKTVFEYRLFAFPINVLCTVVSSSTVSCFNFSSWANGKFHLFNHFVAFLLCYLLSNLLNFTVGLGMQILYIWTNTAAVPFICQHDLSTNEEETMPHGRVWDINLKAVSVFFPLDNEQFFRFFRWEVPLKGNLKNTFTSNSDRWNVLFNTGAISYQIKRHLPYKL